MTDILYLCKRMKVHFSIIVPVYNRPQEMDELLMSLAQQTDRDFEVIVMEGKCEQSCKEIVEQYEDRLRIEYHEEDSGRSVRRNHGIEAAAGNYFLFFDSDCILPRTYIATLRRLLRDDYVDCFGGPDAADADFSVLQRAVNYAMTSFLTTGGIRGGMKDTSKFLPRGFNMGFSLKVYEQVGGFRDMIGEDIDLSMRIREAGFDIRLFKETFVYHKRRVTLSSFYRQVNTFGKARILLSNLHKGSLKLTHLFPSCFVVGHIMLLLLAVLHSPWWLVPIGVYILALFCESLYKNRDIRIAALSVLTSYIQLTGYGMGFMEELITRKASRQAAEQLYRQ